MSEIVIEDDDGFVTTWPWPEDVTLLHGAAFADSFIATHEAARSSE